MPLMLETPKDCTLWGKCRELMTAAFDEMKAALEKHPKFPETLTTIDADVVDRVLQELQKHNEKNNCSARDILNEEIFEFIQAVQSGDKVAAAKELAQVIQVCLRIFFHLDAYIARYKKESK